MGALRDRIGRFLIPGRILEGRLLGPGAGAAATLRLGFAPPTGMRVASVHVMADADVPITVANHGTIALTSGATPIASTTTETQALADGVASRIKLGSSVVTLPPGAPIDVTITAPAGNAALDGVLFIFQVEWQGV